MFRQTCSRVATNSCRRFSSSQRQSNGMGAPILLGFGLGAAAGIMVEKSSALSATTDPVSRPTATATDKAPAAIGPYVQAVRDGKGTVYCSGQVGFIPGTKDFAGKDVRAQTKQALANLSEVLANSNSDVSLVCKTTVLLADMSDYAVVNEEYAKVFGDHPPSRACYAAKGLPAGALVEIEAIAVEK